MFVILSRLCFCVGLFGFCFGQLGNSGLVWLFPRSLPAHPARGSLGVSVLGARRGEHTCYYIIIFRVFFAKIFLLTHGALVAPWLVCHASQVVVLTVLARPPLVTCAVAVECSPPPRLGAVGTDA